MWTSEAIVPDMEPHTVHAHPFPVHPGSEVEGTHLQWRGGLPSTPAHPPHSSPEQLSTSSAWRPRGLPGRGPANGMEGLECGQQLREIGEKQRAGKSICSSFWITPSQHLNQGHVLMMQLPAPRCLLQT